MRTSDSTLTIVTTSYNDEERMESFLMSLLEQTVLPKEIIIADGGSTDDTVQIANRISSNNNSIIQVIEGDKLNIAEGFNLAIKKATTAKIAICCIGNTYDKEFIQNLLHAMDETTADVVYGSVYGQIKNQFAKLYIKTFLNNNRGKKFYLPSNKGVLLNKSIFKQYGFFAESFSYAGEDEEYYIKLRNSNLNIVYEPKAKLYWEVPSTFREYLKKTKGYCIAHLQFYSRKKIFINQSTIIPVIIIFLLTIPMLYPDKLLIWILMGIIGYLGLAFKIKSFNLLVVLFRLFDLFLNAFYHVIYYKKFHRIIN